MNKITEIHTNYNAYITFLILVVKRLKKISINICLKKKLIFAIIFRTSEKFKR